MSLSLDLQIEKRRLAAPFHISGYTFESVDLALVTLGDDAHEGRGEAAGVYYLKDDVANIIETVETHRAFVEGGCTREELREMLPAGGARNAIDCALWELEAARARKPVWALAGLEPPKPLVTTFTIGADAPEQMAHAARDFQQAKSLKLKLTGDLALDMERVQAVRSARPEAWIGVDANQGFSIDSLDALLEEMVRQQVSLVEQPLARGSEADLEGYVSPIPLAADESALHLADIPGLAGRFQVVNIKLDKCGGLTEALAMVAAARELGLGVMVGNMVGTSLAMAPAFIVGQLCDFVDLDGPLFLEADRPPAALYENGTIWCGNDVWGAGC